MLGEAIVSSFLGPMALRISFTNMVKFFVSSGDEDMPAAELVGYSQSRSMPSRSNSATTLAQSAAKAFLFSSVAAISLKRPLPQPPIERQTLSQGASFFRAVMLCNLDSLLILTPLKVSLT